MCSLRDAEPTIGKDAIIYLVKLYDGHDRFYLAAIGIAVGTDPKRREIILADFDKHFPEWNDKVADLVWELRPPAVLPRLGKLLGDEKLSPGQRARIVDILAASDDKAAGLSVLKVLQSDLPAEVQARAIAKLRLFLPGKWAGLVKSDELRAVIDQLLSNPKTATVGLQLVAAAKYTQAVGRVAKLATDGNPEAVRTLGQLPDRTAVLELEKMLRSPSGRAVAGEIVAALGTQLNGRADSPESKQALAVLQSIVTAHDEPVEIKRVAVAALAGSRAGTQWLLDEHAQHKLSAELVADTGRLLRNSPFQGLRNRAMIAFPLRDKLDIAKLPSLNILATRRGDVDRGKQVMAVSLKGDAQCMKCHAVKGVGGNVGPDLATIGTKASRENLFES
ncbi:MAG TPA: hypothetical protein VGH32_06820, partial [Pirellulales bacterium]